MLEAWWWPREHVPINLARGGAVAEEALRALGFLIYKVWACKGSLGIGLYVVLG